MEMMGMSYTAVMAMPYSKRFRLIMWKIDLERRRDRARNQK